MFTRSCDFLLLEPLFCGNGKSLWMNVLWCCVLWPGSLLCPMALTSKAMRVWIACTVHIYFYSPQHSWGFLAFPFQRAWSMDFPWVCKSLAHASEKTWFCKRLKPLRTLAAKFDIEFKIQAEASSMVRPQSPSKKTEQALPVPLCGCGFVDAFALGKHKAVFGLGVPLDAVFHFGCCQARFE